MRFPREFRAARESFQKKSAGQIGMDLEPGRIGFMSTQRRENRWQRSCTEGAEASGLARKAPWMRRIRATASGGTAPLDLRAGLATNSLQSDYRIVQLLHFVRLFKLLQLVQLVQLVQFARQDERSSPPPPGAEHRTAILPQTTHGVSFSRHPSPPGPPCLPPNWPRVPAALSRRTERYDGKGNLYLQHAA
jgi:hypothetical protein